MIWLSPWMVLKAEMVKQSFELRPVQLACEDAQHGSNELSISASRHISLGRVRQSSSPGLGI